MTLTFDDLAIVKINLTKVQVVSDVETPFLSSSSSQTFLCQMSKPK